MTKIMGSGSFVPSKKQKELFLTMHLGGKVFEEANDAFI